MLPREVLISPMDSPPILPCTFRSFPPDRMHYSESFPVYDKVFSIGEFSPVCLGRQHGAGLRVFYFESRGPTRVITLMPHRSNWGIMYSELYYQIGSEGLRSGASLVTSPRTSQRISELVYFEIYPWHQSSTFESFLDGDKFVVEVYDGDRYHRYLYLTFSDDRYKKALRQLFEISLSSLRL